MDLQSMESEMMLGVERSFTFIKIRTLYHCRVNLKKTNVHHGTE